jgi:hypothetical protein
MTRWGQPKLSDVLRRFVVLLGALVSLLIAARGPTSAIRDDELVVMFPSDGRLEGDRWRLPIHGWIYEPAHSSVTRRLFIAALREGFGVEASQLEGALFGERVATFLVDNQRGKVIRVRIGDAVHALEPSDALGHFHGEVALPVGEVNALARGDRLPYEVVFDSPRPRVAGSVRLLAASGTSVISDIDDTIKVTNVRDKMELVKNTFMRPFRAADGMASLYRAWAHEGIQFHYVSSSPWQLYPALAAFADGADFPASSFALKRFRLKDASALDLLADPMDTKPPAIEAIMERYPERLFCLVGDSGEYDPEVYGTVARRHPDRVIRSYIRNVTQEDPLGARFREAFRELPQARWLVFDDPATVPPCAQ